MKLILTAVASAVLLGGCAFLTPKPPPVISEPPREGQTEKAPAEAGGAPATDVKSAGSMEGPTISGHWVSKTVLGSGSENVRRVELIFESGGSLSGFMLIENEGKKRIAVMEGTWLAEVGHLAVKYRDGRARTWSLAWDGAILVLKDGEAELRLERVTE
ncbi:MAG: hypothetical protein AAB074_16710 [Planctomycetota bacterium]